MLSQILPEVLLRIEFLGPRRAAFAYVHAWEKSGIFVWFERRAGQAFVATRVLQIQVTQHCAFPLVTTCTFCATEWLLRFVCTVCLSVVVAQVHSL